MFDARMVIGSDTIPPVDPHAFESYNPYSSEAWAKVPTATSAQVEVAVAAARAAFEGTWRHTAGIERARLMTRLAELMEADADRLARIETTDNGKPIRDTKRQIIFAARNLRYFAGYADKIYGRTIPLDKPNTFDWTTRKPHGVAALITAWNSPTSLLCNKLAPALATGNAVVIKPSEYASVTTCEVGKLALDAGLPPGVVNVVTGLAETGSYLTSSSGIDKISFTGGCATGRKIAEAASRRLVPVTLELGGKSANIIFADADVPRAVAAAASGAFGSTGQSCVAGSRLLVERPIYQEVLEAIVKHAQGIKLGDPSDPETQMGPVANKPQYDRILAILDSARAAGARIETGGGAPARSVSEHALFIEPTVLTGVTREMSVMRDEIFGPVISVIPFTNEAEAVAIANDTEYGLANGVWTRDFARAQSVADELRSGTVWINTYRVNAAQAPSGGIRQSGYGRERGEEAMYEYTYVKNVMMDYSR